MLGAICACWPYTDMFVGTAQLPSTKGFRSKYDEISQRVLRDAKCLDGTYCNDTGRNSERQSPDLSDEELVWRCKQGWPESHAPHQNGTKIAHDSAPQNPEAASHFVGFNASGTHDVEATLYDTWKSDTRKSEALHTSLGDINDRTGEGLSTRHCQHGCHRCKHIRLKTGRQSMRVSWI